MNVTWSVPQCNRRILASLLVFIVERGISRVTTGAQCDKIQSALAAIAGPRRASGRLIAKRHKTKEKSAVEANRNQTGCLKTSLILIGVAVGFIALIVLIADIKCGYDIENWWAPLYPNAVTTKVEYDLFRPRALGETFWYMESTDDVETVKQFYRDTRIATLQAGKTRGIANAESAVHPLEDGEGSLIVLYSACGT